MRAGIRLVHRAGTLVLLAMVVVLAAGLGFAWQVGRKPLDLPFLATRLAAAANAEAARSGTQVRVSIEHAALSWEGFSGGVDRPVDIRLTGITLADAAHGQSVTVPRAEVSLGLGALLLGRIEPRAVEIDGAKLVIQRTEAGRISLHLGDDAPSAGSGVDAILPVIAELSRPEPRVDDTSAFRQLRRVLVRDVTVTIVDRGLNTEWQAMSARIDLRRGVNGGAEGSAEFALRLGSDAPRLGADAPRLGADAPRLGADAPRLGADAPRLGADAPRLRLTGVLDPVVANTPPRLRLHAELAGLRPAALARMAAALRPLAAIDTMLGGEGDAEFAADMKLVHARLEARAGPGSATIGGSTLKLDGARLTAEGDDTAATLTSLVVRLVGHDGGPVSTLSATGALARADARLRATAALAIDHVDFADLSSLWPATLAPPARDWVTGNITAGVARDAHAAITIEANEDGSDLTLSQATGSLLGEGLTVHWLPPVPPIENGTARLDITDPDTLDIAISGGRQALSNGRPEGGLRVQSGTMRISGIMQKDQVGKIDARIAGPIADAIALLREKRLHLFDRFPVELKNPAGQLAGTLSLSIPLEDKVQFEQIPIRAALHLQDAHLAGIAAGHDLDHGDLNLVVTADGLKLSGRAEIAAIPASLDANVDFRAGPAAQVQQRITVSGQPTVDQLVAIGLDTGDALAGMLGLRAVLTERRDGTGDIAIDADLIGAQLSVAPIEWRKPTGTPASASARIRMRRDRVVGIDNIAADGAGLVLRAHAAFQGGALDRVAVDRLDLGRTRVQGSVRFPAVAHGPIEAELSGAVLDLAPVLTRKSGPPSAPGRATAGPAWNVDARFDRVHMAGANALVEVAAHARSDGTVIRELDLRASTAPGAPIRASIAADGTRRRLTASAANAGDLLRALDVIATIQGGSLTLNGHFDDALPDHPVAGTATIEDFRIRNAPAFGQLLQAMTLYGLFDVMQGDGLGFTRLVAPFRLAGDTLDLNDARAFSASLGLTAKGRIDLARERIDVQGTIVPAYFFNSLLGNLPVVGRLFSPEPGGGLFAASYDVRGALADPTVRVNPLAALTPGFLRGLFGGL